MTADKSTWSPVGLALSCVLAALALCLCPDNELLRLYASNGVSGAFVFAFLLGVVALSVAVLVSSHDEEQRRWSIGMGLVTSGIGVVFGMFEPVLPSSVSAMGSGALLGFGLTCLLRQWGRYCRLLSFQGALLNTVFSLLVASCLWLAVVNAGTPFLFCLGMLTLVLCGGLPLIARQIVHAGETAAERSTSAEELSKSLATMRQVVRLGWAAVAGLMFNFFTIGLTFWPEAAGLNTDGLSPKLLAYAVLAIVVWRVVSRAHEPVGGSLDVFYRASLPIAAVIMLASPFVESVLPLSGSFASSVVSYLGIALFNTLGLVILFWLAKCSDVGFSKVFAVYCISCTGAVAAGMIVFQLLGEDAQIVSICVLTAYLVAMVLGELRRGSKRRRMAYQCEGGSLLERCRALSERYALSTCESEILPLLARGREARHIADKLRLSPETVHARCKRIYEKTGVHAKEELLDLIEEFEL